MEQVEKRNRNKGGRPKKVIKKGQSITVKCSLFDKQAIKARAKIVGLTPSEYLRELGLAGQIDMRKRKLPEEVLELKGELKHIGSNLNQIAKKRNSNEMLDAVERANLLILAGKTDKAVSSIEKYLQ